MIGVISGIRSGTSTVGPARLRRAEARDGLGAATGGGEAKGLPPLDTEASRAARSRMRSASSLRRRLRASISSGCGRLGKLPLMSGGVGFGMGMDVVRLPPQLFGGKRNRNRNELSKSGGCAATPACARFGMHITIMRMTQSLQRCAKPPKWYSVHVSICII